MALTITIDGDLEDLIEKMALAGVRHPTDLTKVFLPPFKVELSLGAEDAPTMHIESSGDHDWQYVSEPSTSFDDRTLS